MFSIQDWFATTDTQKDWLRRIGEVVDRHAAETRRADETNGFNYSLVADLKRIGYPVLTVPRQFGGSEITLTDLLLYQERIAQGDASIALAIGWHMFTMHFTQTRVREPRVFAALCRDVLERGALVNRIETEVATGSPSRGGIPQTRAERTDSGYRITGRKTFASLAPALDYFIISAFDTEAQHISEFLIPREAPGLSVEPTWDMVGMRGTGSHELVLEAVAVPDEAKLFERSDVSALSEPIPYMLFIPATYLGIALGAREEALRFAQKYQPNSLDKPIASLPHVRQLIGQIELELSSARHSLYGLAGRWEQEHLQHHAQAAPDLAAIKVVAIQTALSVVDKAMRIVGAHSLAASNPLQRMYRDVRFGLHNPPMEDAAIRQLAQRALGE
ncbi:acyl-CoA dehydrogenase family protein [Paenibacillus filicis]|uniref:Acyl-CoA dehydrogenase family protein n=1 Tax=Paenibacillus filicis TaxID=669464 RepID=A0ABU9DSM0_9BACL